MRKPSKPHALAPGNTIAVVSPGSPPDAARVHRGIENLEALGYCVNPLKTTRGEGFFSASADQRAAELDGALRDPRVSAIFCSRGGYGSAELLPRLKSARFRTPKIFCGYSDATAIQVFLWERLRWVTLYGPMVSSGFDAGANATLGFDPETFQCCTTLTRGAWSHALSGETLARGAAAGILLGGCLTVLDTLIGTPWELDTRGSILLLEDRGVKPYQLDRMLVHFAQAGKFKGVRGIVLGDFPDSDPPQGSDITALDVCRRVLAPLRIPILFGAPVGHTTRPMLTVPLGIRARLIAGGEGRLEILEPAVRA